MKENIYPVVTIQSESEWYVNTYPEQYKFKNDPSRGDQLFLYDKILNEFKTPEIHPRFQGYYIYHGELYSKVTNERVKFYFEDRLGEFVDFSEGIKWILHDSKLDEEIRILRILHSFIGEGIIRLRLKK